jgi:hypothetical protein
MAMSVQRLQRWRRWRSDCGGGIGCGSGDVSWRNVCSGNIGCGSGGISWHNDCSDSSILAVVAAILLVSHSDYGGSVSAGIAAISTVLVQGLRW